MKDYKGITDVDIPLNGGSYVTKNSNGGEVYNFQNYFQKLILQ